MPIRPELRHFYTRKSGWHTIRATIRETRAGWRCECSGQCGGFHRGQRCSAPHLTWIARPHGDPDAWVPVAADARVADARVLRVVIGVAHLDHNPENNNDANLLAVCQRCHLLHDRRRHAATRAHAVWADERARGQQDLVLDVLARRSC